MRLIDADTHINEPPGLWVDRVAKDHKDLVPRVQRFEEGDAPQLASSGEEVWELFTTVYGPTRTLAENLPDERRAQFHRDFVEYFDGFRTDTGVHNPRPYRVVIGTRRTG